nr:MAG TPA: hypothetical protein [Caudoviricetes sp.]
MLQRYIIFYVEQEIYIIIYVFNFYFQLNAG